MDRIGKELLEEMDDQGFCECLIAIMGNPTSSGYTLVYDEWVLARLQLIMTRAAHLYYAVFEGPFLAMFPGKVSRASLQKAMQSVGVPLQIAGGDLPPADFAAAIEETFLHGVPKGHSTGWPGLDTHYTVRRGEFSVVTGVSNHMKSSFVLSLTVHLARHHGWNFSLFNPEHHPVGPLGQWIVEAYTNREMHALEPDERHHAISWVVDHFHMITPPDESQPSLAWLLAVAREQHEHYGLEGLVLDPWNEIEHAFAQDGNETQYISACLSQIRRFARTHNMHVWIVAHPTKLPKATAGPYAGKHPPPTPYDIAGSAAWYAKPDNCLSIWRDVTTDSPVVEVHIQKVRNRAVGRIGKIDLRFDGRRFTDLGDMIQPHWTG